MITTDGNNAVASVAYRTNEVIAIYPITPSSTMAEQADAGPAMAGKTSGATSRVVEMQSEGGAIATVHGALQTGALSTSFTSSQGLLLMIPTLYKLAGELTPFAARRRAYRSHARAVYLRRPFGRDGGAPDRLRHAVRRQRAGSAGLRADLADRHPQRTRAVYPFLRRLPHLARNQQDRAAQQRYAAANAAAGGDRRSPQPSAVAGSSGGARHFRQPGHLFPIARSRQPVV